LLARGDLTTVPTDHDAPPDQPWPDDNDDTVQALAAFGLVAAAGTGRNAGPQFFYLWPEHQDAFGLFIQCNTQWRYGSSGITGLDYSGVEALIRMRRLVPRQRLPDVLAELRVLEDETLAEWGRQRSAAERSAQRRRGD
jgi:hypothetical protein